MITGHADNKIQCDNVLLLLIILYIEDTAVMSSVLFQDMWGL